MGRPVRIEPGLCFGYIKVLGFHSMQGKGRNRHAVWCVQCTGPLCDGTPYLMRENNIRRAKGCRFCSISRHAKTKSPLYYIWNSMRSRCYTPSCSGYENYGGRGIRVCDRWACFETWLEDMGPRPTPQHSIERRDNNGDYTPENCYWATRKEQANNSRNNVVLTHEGVTLTATQWAEKLGMVPKTLQAQIRQGRTIADIVADPTPPLQRYLFEGESLSVRQIASRMRIGHTTLLNRIRRHGYDQAIQMETALAPEAHQFPYQGELHSANSLAKILKTTSTTLVRRVDTTGLEAAIQFFLDQAEGRGLNPNIKDLRDQRFGHWLVLAHDVEQSEMRGQAFWRCRCDCGETRSLAGHELRRGCTQSCGCSDPRLIDLTGQTFGYYTVLGRDTSVQGRTAWSCRCVCGAVRSVRSYDLRKGSARSCGCVRGQKHEDSQRTASLLRRQDGDL